MYRLLSFLTLLSIVAGIADAQDRITPAHVAKTRLVVAAEISPDGHRVAFVRAVPRDPFTESDGRDRTELWVTEPGGGPRRFTSGKSSVSQVRWTPDGRAITFVSKRAGDEAASLYRIALDMGEAERIVAPHSTILSYSIAADGKQVAWVAADPASPAARARVKRGFKAQLYEENERRARVWIASTDPAADDARALDLEEAPFSVLWSPDGARLAVTVAPSRRTDDRYMARRIAIVDPESGQVTARVKNPGKLGRIAWSPDSRRLALISADEIHDPRAGRLMVAEIGQGECAVRDLVPADRDRAQFNALAWQDATTVMFLRDEGTATAFGKVSLRGEKKILCAHEGLVCTAFTLDRAGRSAAFVASSPHHPNEVFVMRHGEEQPTRVTDSNPWLAKTRLAKQEAVTYRARDGLEIEGILVHPLERAKGARVPLIVAVHGGPESHLRNGWVTRYLNPGQLGAARGYAVFYPNYRGSTGRGVKFSQLGQSDPAGKEFDDLVDAVEHLVKIGLVDRKKVGITGGSYGGYAAAWAATRQTEHFAAAVMFAGVSNRISKAGTTDIPEEAYLVHERFQPWTRWPFLLERSPIAWVEQARTPILIAHGRDDARVHPEQAMQLYRHLKRLGKVPVRLVFYPGEGHGNRKAAGKIDYNLRMMRWFDFYLRGPGGRELPPERLDHEKLMNE